MNVIEVHDLVKRYKEVLALDHLSLELHEGEILGLLGPNGSGKTTAINCMLALLHYDSGSIRIFGEPMRPDSYQTKRAIGVVPQEVSVFNRLNVRENIDYFCGLYIDDAAERKKLVDEAIDFVGLNEYKKFLPKKLSGGLRRRLNIACGIAHRPKLIFFDEPTVAVDPQSRNFILEGIRRLQQEGASVIYTTHYMEEAEMLCDRIVILDKGRQLVNGTTAELKNMIRDHEKVEVSFVDPPEDLVKQLEQLENVRSVSRKEWDFTIRFEKGSGNMSQLLHFIELKGLKYRNLNMDEPSLNDVFLELTGKELRE